MTTTTPQVHVVQVLGDFGLGGDGRVARDLSLALAAQGVRATCVALRSRKGAAPPDGPYALVYLPADQGWMSFLRAARGFRRFVADAKPDVLHIHGPQSLVFAAAALLGMRRKPPLWFTWHDSSVVLGMGWFRDRAVLWAMRRAAHIFGSSQSVADRLAAVLPPGTRCEVFRNGVVDLGPTRGMDADVPVLVWVGRLVPPKDPLIFVRAMARLRAEGVRFRAILAGGAPPHLLWFEKQVRDLVASSGLEDVVRMPGWISDLTDCWHEGAIGVQTSHTEGLSIALLESMMAGMATVATDVGDTGAAVQDGTTGILIRPEDEDALCDALRRVIADPALRRAMGDAARRRALAEFSLPAMARQVLSRVAR